MNTHRLDSNFSAGAGSSPPPQDEVLRLPLACRAGEVGIVSPRGSKNFNISGFGVDTVHIRVEDFEVPPGHRLEVKSGSRILFESGERVVSGTRAVFNGMGVTVTVYAPNNMHVEFSPRVLHGSNYDLFGEGRLMAGVSEVERVLREQVGVLADLYGARVLRLDIARNLAIDRDPYEYAAALRHHMGPPRQTLVSDFPTSLAWGNGSQCTAAYSKTEEMRSRGEDVEAVPETYRLETRFLRCDVVERETGVRTLSDLLTPAGWRGLGEAYFNKVGRDLREPPEARETVGRTTEDWLVLIREAQREAGSKWLQHLANAALLSELSRTESAPEFWRAVAQEGGSSKKGYRKRRMKDAEPIAGRLSEEVARHRARYAELRDLALAPLASTHHPHDAC